MELNENDIDLVDRYFRNELSAEELKSFQLRLKEADFHDAVNSYLNVFNLAKEMGRFELLSVLNSVRMDFKRQKNAFDAYTPSKKGPGGSAGFITSVIIILVCISAYIIYKSNPEPNLIPSADTLHSVSPSRNTIDTVFHYRVKRDTVYINAGKHSTRIKTDTPIRSGHIIRTDTIFVQPR